MNLKKNRFVIRDKEAENKDRRLKKNITVYVLLFSVIIPLINEGVIYTLWNYTANDAALAVLDFFLRYLVVIVRYICWFGAYGAVAASLVYFGVKKSLKPVLLMLMGGSVAMFAGQWGSFLFLYFSGFYSQGDSVDVLNAAFQYGVSAIFEAVRNAALAVVCALATKKLMKKKDGLFIPNDTVEYSGKKQFVSIAFRKNGIFFKYCTFAALVHLVYDLLVNVFRAATYDPSRDLIYLDYVSMLIMDVIVPVGCAVGLFTMAAVTLKLGTYKSHKLPMSDSE